MFVDQLAAGHAEVGLEHVRLEGRAATLPREMDLVEQVLVRDWHGD